MVIVAMIYKSDAGLTGYDIAKKLQDKTGHSHQQVYRELRKLESAGRLVSKTIPQAGKPDRVEYRSAYESSVFCSETPTHSDHRKSSMAMQLFVQDVVDGTNHYDDYINAMAKAENDFLMSYGFI